ncbi:MAG: hypothetical protein ACLVLC_05450 [Finegoldia magna]
MKIFLFEASLIRNIKFSMMIFSSIACLNGHNDDCGVHDFTKGEWNKYPV